MINKLANRYVDYLIANGIDSEDRDVYIYGFECFMSEVVANILVFTIAFIIGKPLEMLIWQVFWLPFRLNLGGIHASNQIRCLIYSTLLAVVCVILAPYLTLLPWLIPIEVLFSIIIAFKIAPVVHPNRLISDKRKHKLKTIGRLLCVIESAIILIVFFASKTDIWFSTIASTGMFSAAVLCLLGKVKFSREVS